MQIINISPAQIHQNYFRYFFNHLVFQNQPKNQLIQTSLIPFYNYALPMKHQSTSSSKQLTKIRREQRNKELQQVRNTLRFITSAKDSILQVDHYGTSSKLTQSQLQQILSSTDLNKFYQYAAQDDYQNEELLEQYAMEIIHFLKQRLSLPLAALTLSCLIKNLQVYNILAYNQQLIGKIVYQMINLHPTIEAQSIYIWALCAATERPELVQKQQLKPVLQTLQNILKDLVLKQDKQDYILVQLFKNLSEMQFLFSEDLVLNLCNYYWKINKQTLLMNIYFISINLLKTAAFEPSTKVLINLIIVYLKGMSKITTKIDSYLPGLYTIMSAALKSYKKISEYVSQDQIQIDDAKITTTFHSFLLQYESQLFKNNDHSPQYLSFLLEFCIHSPVFQTLKNWFEFGTIQHIASILTLSPQTCEMGLQILYTLSSRAHFEQRDFLMLGAIKQYCKIQFVIQEATNLFSSTKLNHLAQKVLGFFTQIA